jgi:hypothetical protein
MVVGLLYFFIYLATSNASKMAAKFQDKNKLNASSKTLLMGFLLGLLVGLFYLFDLWVMSLLAFVSIYLIENLRKPILTGMIADNVPNELLTSIISAQNLIRTLMSAMLALVFGVCADHFGIPIALITVSMILLAISLVINLKTRKHLT